MPLSQHCNMLAQAKIQSCITPLSKRDQIVGYASLTVKYHMSLKAISAAPDVPISTCLNIVRLSKHCTVENPNASDERCAVQNIKPTSNCEKGDNQELSNFKMQQVITLTTSDATHCRKVLNELVAESHLQISTSSLRRILAADRIHCRAATTKPYLKNHQKRAHLQFVKTYLYLDWIKVLFLDEAYFELYALRSSHAGVVFSHCFNSVVLSYLIIKQVYYVEQKRNIFCVI